MERLLSVLWGPRRSLVANLVAALLIALAWVAVMRGAPRQVPESLNVLAIALATVSIGWLGGGLWLVAPVSFFIFKPGNLVAPDVLLDSSIVYLLTGAMRSVTVKLRMSQMELRAFLAGMKDVVIKASADGVFLDVAPTRQDLLYLPPSELIGRRFDQIFDPAQAERFLAEVRRALTNRQTVNYDYELTIGSRLIYFSAAITPIDEGTVVWVARDITDRKKAEHALLDANATLERRVAEGTGELRRIFEQATDVIFSLDAGGAFTSLNPAFDRLLGLDRQEWLGRSFVDLIAAENLDESKKLFVEASESGEVLTVPVKVRTRDGRDLIIEVALTRQLIDGGFAGFSGIGREITARVRAERALRRSEEQLIASQRIARLGSADVNLRTKHVWWSDEHCRLFGLEPGTSIETDQFLLAFPEAERSRIERAQQKMFQQGSAEWESPIVRPDGTEKVLIFRATIVERDEKGPVRLIGTVQDITAERMAEERLRRSEERFRLFARATNDAVWDWDKETGVVWRSEAYARLFGWSVDDPTLMRIDAWKSRIHPDDAERVIRGVEHLLETEEESWVDEYRFRRADGTYAIVVDRGYIVRDAEKRAVRMTGSMSDVTERKRLEEQLAHAQRVSSLGRVAASIAHEFNNVLMGIQPNVEIIRRLAGQSVQKPIDHIVESVRRGKRVTDEILRFARRSDPILQSVAVRQFLERWKDEAHTIVGKTLEIDIDIDDDSLHVAADRLHLAQIFTNLAMNARDAVSAGRGTLRITAERVSDDQILTFAVVKDAGAYVHIAVSDNGNGMSREEIDHAFEPLFTTKRGGTGLGLAITYQLVERHSGQIYVESDVGKGATFHILLPATAAGIEHVDHEQTRDWGIRSALIVEDEEAVASGLSALLEMEGIVVEVVTTGAEVMSAIERYGPDVVILDVGLPDRDGSEVYADIEERWPDLPVLFSSGHADPAKLEEFLRRPNVGILLKPYDLDKLKRSLLGIVAGASTIAN